MFNFFVQYILNVFYYFFSLDLVSAIIYTFIFVFLILMVVLLVKRA